MTAATKIQISRDLAEIITLGPALRSQAVNDATAIVDGHSLPGGRAMVALAPVASLARWEQRVEEREATWADYEAERRQLERTVILADPRRPDFTADEDDTAEPALQVIRFWSDHYRRVMDQAWDHVPTLDTEAKFLRHNLDWINAHEPHWTQLVTDVARARRHLENILSAGQRAERGVPCMYDECRGVRLVRKLVPTRDQKTGEKIWVLSDWHCPRCKRTWDNDAYWRNVQAANERAQREDIDGETWCSIDYAARDTRRSVKTIRTWIDRGDLSVLCVIVGRRTKWVNLDEVRQRHATAESRSRTRTA